jgi:hypothetical protein
MARPAARGGMSLQKFARSLCAMPEKCLSTPYSI